MESQVDSGLDFQHPPTALMIMIIMIIMIILSCLVLTARQRFDHPV